MRIHQMLEMRNAEKRGATFPAVSISKQFKEEVSVNLDKNEKNPPKKTSKETCIMHL